MTLQEKILETESLNKELDALAKEKEALEQKIKEKEEAKANYLSEILEELKKDKKLEEQVGDVFATYFSKEDITWLDDTGLLASLKQNGANEFIKVVTTTKESIDKNALKKAFKANESLREQYKQFYGNKLTEYVVVNSGETHQRMLEHITGGNK